MKIISSRFALVLIFMFGGAVICFGGNPPAPAPGPPPPPGLAIDENVFVLIVIALFLGGYVIYSHKLKTKTPN